MLTKELSCPSMGRATEKSVREAISGMVRVSADALTEGVGHIVVTTSEQLGMAPVFEQSEALQTWFGDSVMDRGATLAGLRESALSARNAYEGFERAVRDGKEPDADTYFQLSAAVSEAEDVLASALIELPDDGFALKASTRDGRLLMLNLSAQKPGHYQLTRFDKNGAPWGDTQYPTKKQAIVTFLDEADVATVQDFDGWLALAKTANVFQEWFGGSKVVGTDGRPLVVYHGTTVSFDAFKMGRRGAFFADDPASAAMYSGSGDGSNVMPAYLKIARPYQGHVGRKGPEIGEVIAEAKRGGHDGAFVTYDDFPGETAYVAFSPEQIKSAIGNRGTYDPQSPDIRNSLAGFDPRAQAWHDGRTNTTVFLADRIAAGREGAVFLHEVVHRHGRQALPEGRWGALVGQVKAWAQAKPQSPERFIHDAAQIRVGRAGVAGALADEELFAYAVEEAVAMGVEPTAAAVTGSAQAWLQVVLDSIQRVGERLIGNDLQQLGGQDLVDLAYALAQLDSPVYGFEVRRALQEACMPMAEVVPTLQEPGSFEIGAGRNPAPF